MTRALLASMFVVCACSRPDAKKVEALSNASVAFLRHSMATLGAMSSSLNPKDCATGDTARLNLEKEHERSRALFKAVKEQRAAVTEAERAAADEKSHEALSAELDAIDADEEAMVEKLRAFHAACPDEAESLSKASASFSKIPEET